MRKEKNQNLCFFFALYTDCTEIEQRNHDVSIHVPSENIASSLGENVFLKKSKTKTKTLKEKHKSSQIICLLNMIFNIGI